MKLRYILSSLLFLAIVSIWGLLAISAPQNNNLSKQQIDNQQYNDTYGVRQVSIIAQIATTPQNNSLSSSQIANFTHNATYGAEQVVLTTSTGEQVPFLSLTSITEGDLLYYNASGENWKNTQGKLRILETGARLNVPQVNDATTPSVSFGDGDTGIYEQSDDNLYVAVNGSAQFFWIGSSFGSVASGGGRILNFNGTAASPTFYFNGDGNTGLYAPAADQVGISTGGAERVVVSSTLVTQKVGQAIKATNAGAVNYNPSALTSDYLIFANNTGGARSITISTEDVQSGSASFPRTFLIKDHYGAASGNNITLALESGTIDGAASVTISTDYAAVKLYCDGTNCYIY